MYEMRDEGTLQLWSRRRDQSTGKTFVRRKRGKPPNIGREAGENEAQGPRRQSAQCMPSELSVALFCQIAVAGDGASILSWGNGEGP